MTWLARRTDGAYHPRPVSGFNPRAALARVLDPQHQIVTTFIVLGDFDAIAPKHGTPVERGTLAVSGVDAAAR